MTHFENISFFSGGNLQVSRKLVVDLILYSKLELNIKYCRSTDKYFQEPVAFWTCQINVHSHRKRKFVQFLTCYFQKLSSFSYCWWRQSIRKDCLSFDRVYTSICIFTQKTKTTALYSLPSSEKFLFSSLTLHFCGFLDKGKILCISKKQNQY